MVTESDGNALQGRKILVTRPEAQSVELAQLIEKHGGEPILFPVISIADIDVEQWVNWTPYQTDWLIFVSRNAVNSFVKGYKDVLPNHIKCVAAGDGTAAAMREHGLPVHLQPAESDGSEGLLRLPQWQQMQAQQVVIVRGQGGRELLAETLQSRGASILYIEVYRRQLPNVSSYQRQQAGKADWLIATSVNSVQNLLGLLGGSCSTLLQKPLLVVSQRIQTYAQSQGFKTVYQTQDASNSSIIQRLIEMGSDHGA